MPRSNSGRHNRKCDIFRNLIILSAFSNALFMTNLDLVVSVLVTFSLS